MDEQRQSAHLDEVEALLRAAGETERLDPQVRAAHLAHIRARAVELGGTSTRRVGSEVLGRVAAAVIAVAVVVGGGFGTTAWAAQDALPGDRLYGVKTAAEQVQALWHISDEATVGHQLDRAERRLVEAESLIVADHRPDTLLDDVFNAHAQLLEDAAARAAGDPELEARVAAAATAAVDRMEALLAAELPDEASQQARDSLQAVVDRLRERGTGPPAEQPAGPPAERPAGPPASPGAPHPGERPQPAPAPAPDPDDRRVDHQEALPPEELPPPPAKHEPHEPPADEADRRRGTDGDAATQRRPENPRPPAGAGGDDAGDWGADARGWNADSRDVSPPADGSDAPARR